MANCITCGRALPAFTFGRGSDVCPQCRASAIDVPTGYTAEPAYSQQPARPTGAVKRRAPVTTALVGLNAAVFVAMAISGVSLSEPTNQQLVHWGANYGPLSLGSQPWRMLTSNYVHIGVIHILFNMWCLWDLGNLAERIFDPLTYILTYTACGLAGSLGSLWWHPMVTGAGASGAIFGLAGALIAALRWGNLPIPKQAIQQTMRSLLIFAGYNLFLGQVGAGIDNSAHIGGLLSGVIIGGVLSKHLTESEDVRNRWRNGVLAVTFVVLLIVFGWVKKANSSLNPAEQGMNFRPHDISRQQDPAA